MKFTCLSKGTGSEFPACHILNVCGFRILLECPLDLSALTIFSPVQTDCRPSAANGISDCDQHTSSGLESEPKRRKKDETVLDAMDLIHVEPWYKTVKNLHLWDASFIDIVLISSPMGILGLPFLTRMKGFSAKIYVTEATARIGQLVMEDLISMHMEFRQFYGSQEPSFPHWMEWDEVGVLPSSVRKIVFGDDGEELGCWMPLYSAVDIKNCMKKLQTLRFAEEVCYNGNLILKALSSGSEIGACNWIIDGPKRNISYLSGSIFISPHAMSFDYNAHQGNDLVLYSDLSYTMEDAENGHNSSASITANLSTHSGGQNLEELTSSILGENESTEEREKLAFICFCALDSVKAGGSVLVTINRLGTILQLLEQMSIFIESSDLQVPIFVISSVAEELMAYTNTIPEWLCRERQEKMFSGEALFAHTKLIKEKKIHLFPAIHSPNLLTSWQEPCIVFAPHWSLRLGPSVHLLHRWCGNTNSLLVLEAGVDANLALSPYKPMQMKVLQCSLLSGIRSQKILPLLKLLQPKLVLFPDPPMQQFCFADAKLFSVLHYTENVTMRIPSIKDSTKVDIAMELASNLNWKKLKHQNLDITRLKGELSVDHGKQKFLLGSESRSLKEAQHLVHWGSPSAEKLAALLAKMGIHGSIGQGRNIAESGSTYVLNIEKPTKGLIEVGETGSVISTSEENIASCISEAIATCLDGI